LKLDTVRQNRWECAVKLRPQNDTVSLKLTPGQRNHLPRSLSQVDRFNDEVFSSKKVAQTCDDFGSAVAVANGTPHGFASALDIGRVRCQHPRARACVGDDTGKRLAH